MSYTRLYTLAQRQLSCFRSARFECVIKAQLFIVLPGRVVSGIMMYEFSPQAHTHIHTYIKHAHSARGLSLSRFTPISPLGPAVRKRLLMLHTYYALNYIFPSLAISLSCSLSLLLSLSLALSLPLATSPSFVRSALLSRR